MPLRLFARREPFSSLESDGFRNFLFLQGTTLLCPSSGAYSHLLTPCLLSRHVSASSTAKYTDVNTTVSALPTAIVTRSTNLHDMQIYGCIITALLGAAVFGGAKMIARLGPSFLIPVMVSIIFIFIGIVTAPRGDMSRERAQTTLVFSFLVR
jgi:hypothetical protein